MATERQGEPLHLSTFAAGQEMTPEEALYILADTTGRWRPVDVDRAQEIVLLEARRRSELGATGRANP